VEKAIAAKAVTVDLASQINGAKVVGCAAFGDIIGKNL
jgi:isocitrate dehydrogenase